MAQVMRASSAVGYRLATASRVSPEMCLMCQYQELNPLRKGAPKVDPALPFDGETAHGSVFDRTVLLPLEGAFLRRTRCRTDIAGVIVETAPLKNPGALPGPVLNSHHRACSQGDHYLRPARRFCRPSREAHHHTGQDDADKHIKTMPAVRGIFSEYVIFGHFSFC